MGEYCCIGQRSVGGEKMSFLAKVLTKPPDSKVERIVNKKQGENAHGDYERVIDALVE
jgi:hypothetical protein